MDPIAAGMQLLGIAASGNRAPTDVSSSNGNFANQYQMFGLPGWNVNLGGDGPPQAQAFSNRPDSLVLGLTGIDSATGAAAGNGVAVSQPAAVTRGWSTLALVGCVGFGLAMMIFRK
jgi:hypothetical protein